jgi:hypothetical protein
MALQDCLRIYDQTMSDFVGGFAVDGNPVVTIFSTPDRPFGEVVDELTQVDEEFRSQMMETNLVASVARLDPMYNPKLRVDVPFGRVLKVPLNSQGDQLASEYPRPYIIPYQFDLRARSRTDANLWMQWIQFKFNPYVCFNVDFGVLWGRRQIQTILDTIVDNSELEKGEKERWIRWTVKIRILNAWIFPIITDTDDVPDPFGMFKIYKVVKKVVVDIYTSPNNPPVPDPTLPGVDLVDTVTRAEVDSVANVPVESK